MTTKKLRYCSAPAHVVGEIKEKLEGAFDEAHVNMEGRDDVTEHAAFVIIRDGRQAQVTVTIQTDPDEWTVEPNPTEIFLEIEDQTF